MNKQTASRHLIILSLLIMVDELGFWILLPVLAPLVTQSTGHFLGVSASPFLKHLIYGLTMGIGSFFTIVSGPFLGFLSDKLGRKKILVLSLLTTFLGYLMYTLGFYTVNLIYILIARFLISVFSSSQTIAQASIAEMYSAQPKILNMSRVACAMTFPLIIGPFIGGYFADSHQVKWFTPGLPFLIVSLVTLLNLIFLVWGFKDKRTHFYQSFSFKSSLAVFLKPRVARGLILFFLLELSWSLYFQSLPLLLGAKFHYTSSQIGFFIAFVGTFMSISLAFLIKPLLKFLKTQQLLSLSLSILTITLLLTFLFPFNILLWALSIPVAFSVGVAYTTLITLISDNVGAGSHQGLVMGFTNALLATAFTLTALLAGILSYIGITLPLIFSTILSAAGWFIFFLITP